MTFAVASAERPHRASEDAFEPVYAELAADPETKAAIEAITGLKTEVAASAEAPACASTAGACVAGIPEGVSIPDGSVRARR